MSDQNDSTENLHAMRHSLAHIMATAIQELWPTTKFGVGPVIADGFYYDVDLGQQSVGVGPVAEARPLISVSDFAAIEERMQAIITANVPFERSEKPIDEAIIWAQNTQQPYKEELLNDLKRAGTTVAKDLNVEELGTIASGEAQVKNVSFYTNGDFIDLCRGPHVESTGKVGAFKLLRVGGVYWRGREGNPQMQRIYGVAFATPKELRQHLEMLEEAKRRDHRKLGQELDLFVFSDLVGPGLPLFTPRGTVLRDQIGAFSQELQARSGYQKVSIPHIAKVELYKKSGHYDKYPERFSVTSHESDDEFMMKPMNCPHHAQIYASRPRSYRDLPVRYMENTMVYRDEKAGELHGLSRVRAATQDDAHVFCRLDQLEVEFKAIMGMIQEMYTVFGLKWKARLSFRDNSEKYLGDPEVWKMSQEIIEKVARDMQIDYFVTEGDAAFYGPKIDIMAIDALGREWQLATEQLDFIQPQRFELEYVAEDGSKQTPVMIHKALLGSFERFLAIYIEHTAGKFPPWTAPEQVRLISVNQEGATIAFVQSVVEQANQLGLRVSVDNSNESVGKKIRAAEVFKVPYTLVLGEKEMAGEDVTPRIRKDMDVSNANASLPLADFLQTVCNEAKGRVTKSSL
jgi:threonyl-tRNA synthetase